MMGRNTLVSTHTSPPSTAYAFKIVATHNKRLWREHLGCDTRAPCAQGPQPPQKEFDSTLGYPGEGPIVPKLVVATFNVQGLKMDTSQPTQTTTNPNLRSCSTGPSNTT